MRYSLRETILATLVVSLALTLCGTLLYYHEPKPARYAEEDFVILPGQGITARKEAPIVQKVFPGLRDSILEGQVLFNGIMSDKYFQIHFPQGFNPIADSRLRHWASEEFTRIASAHCQYFAESEARVISEKIASADFWRYKKIVPVITTYTITETPAGYTTVRLRSSGYDAEGKDYWRSTGFSFHKHTGESISLEELFPHQSISVLAELLTSRLSQLIGQSSTGYIKEFESQEVTVSAKDIQMAQITLVPEGMVYVFDPSRFGSFVRDEMTELIPFAELKRLGVNTRFWKTPPQE